MRLASEAVARIDLYVELLCLEAVDRVVVEYFDVSVGWVQQQQKQLEQQQPEQQQQLEQQQQQRRERLRIWVMDEERREQLQRRFIRQQRRLRWAERRAEGVTQQWKERDPGSAGRRSAPFPMKQNFMKLTFHWPILKLTTSAQNHNKEHMELKFRMKEVTNDTFCSFLLQRTKKSTLK